jgi:hypothetical protein
MQAGKLPPIFARRYCFGFRPGIPEAGAIAPQVLSYLFWMIFCAFLLTLISDEKYHCVLLKRKIL